MNATEPRPVRYRVELFGLLTIGAAEGIKVRVLDLSETGAFIERVEGLDELQQDDKVRLTLSFPGVGQWWVDAVVGRLGNSRLELKRPKVSHVTVVRDGFGLEFQSLEDDALEQLRDFLELLDQR